MKKLLTAVCLMAMVALGFVGAAPSPAQADTCPKYTGCFPTVTAATTPPKVKAKKAVKITTSVASAGNVTPQGTLTIVVSRKGHVVYTATAVYAGGSFTFTVPKKAKKRHGKYTVTIAFAPAPNQPFSASVSATKFKVKKRR